MERLTVRTGVYENGEYKSRIGLVCGASVQDALDRLAAIEDILGDEYDLGRLRELAQADKEGKIPKYTIGDTVYDRFGSGWEVGSLEYVQCAYERKWLYRCGRPGTGDYCSLYQDEIRSEHDG